MMRTRQLKKEQGAERDGMGAAAPALDREGSKGVDAAGLWKERQQEQRPWDT